MTPVLYMALGAGIFCVLCLIVFFGLVAWMEHGDKMEDLVGPRNRSRLP